MERAPLCTQQCKEPACPQQLPAPAATTAARAAPTAPLLQRQPQQQTPSPFRAAQAWKPNQWLSSEASPTHDAGCSRGCLMLKERVFPLPPSLTGAEQELQLTAGSQATSAARTGCSVIRKGQSSHSLGGLGGSSGAAAAQHRVQDISPHVHLQRQSQPSEPRRGDASTCGNLISKNIPQNPLITQK